MTDKSKAKRKGEELVAVTKAALEDVKAQDIQVIDVRDKQSITDYMIIATGTSNRQINAMPTRSVKRSRPRAPSHWVKKARATATGCCWTWTTSSCT
jgi:ribosomal silencing factor RsfS